MPADTYTVAPDAPAQLRIQELEAVIRQQMHFLDRIESADTGWWDKAEMADQKAALWNALPEAAQ